MDIAGPITAVEVHAAGEPGRVIVRGVPDVPGATMFEKKTYLERHADALRLRMLREPRGYPALCCNVVLPPTHPDADAGFVIMEQTEYPGMSGSNTICVVTALLETGLVEAVEPLTPLTLETPAGLIAVEAEVAGGRVTNVTFENVPAFVTHLDVTLEVPTLGPVKVDVAYGGMFYVIAEAAQFDLRLVPDEGRQIAAVGERLRQAAHDQLAVVHPDNPAIGGVSISQLSGPPRGSGAHRRNAVVVSTGPVDFARPDTWGGALDRSPCGTGTCAAMAVRYARGELGIGDVFRHEGVLGTIFTGRVLGETTVGDHPAIRTSLSGQGWITGHSHFVLADDDPFPEGFTVGDIW
jgi:proline racemase